MSGKPTRDRDLGRTWESGASKRKRKTETEKSNQAMSSSMIKFFKKPLSTVTNSESSDESLGQISFVSETEPASESNVSVVTQEFERNKDLESDKFCDSVNQEQAIHLSDSFINLDAGKWTFPITDSQRHELIQTVQSKSREI